MTGDPCVVLELVSLREKKIKPRPRNRTFVPLLKGFFSKFPMNTLFYMGGLPALEICKTTYMISTSQFRIFEVIYQTRATVFHRDIQTPRRELKIRRAAEYF